MEGDTLLGLVTVSVDASDNLSVDRVEYYIDEGQAGTGLPKDIATVPPLKIIFNKSFSNNLL